ncbi:DUF3857 domain-containing protein [Tenacibaculum caenipelagi]|uniref:Uncharacterized protein DUF3858 n=1 Tax=Tenacibaculum caenipelagi TaxID=1325435 RepID=A0A4R6TE52_9FLAO|nr:DUF3857 domain-containing protein [Tenacibaculum caenipelagi]TDQ22733.1 uncharacterized protein DUF3858 [Tenacibaculum caenipelagi]
MKDVLLILTCLFFINSFSQKKKSTKIGNVDIKELNMSQYDKDTTANAVVLYEHANYYIDENKDYKKTTDYYFKVKILKKEGTNKATIQIPFYGDEKVHSIKGISYNISKSNTILKKHLLDNQVYTKDLYGKWKEITFTLPNIKVGSVIEYTYSVTSPYSKIDDWYFQSDIPKIKSDFTAAILGNWKYNIRVIGFLKLNRNNASIKKRCVHVPGLGHGACLILDYGIDNIPAFKEEDYMLSKDNFISKLSFDLESYQNPRGGIDKYTKTWKDADRSLKRDFLDNQTSKKGFFKNQLPPSLFLIVDDLERAKKTYDFIQNYFTWNDKYWPSKKVRIKEAFENKTGNIFDINLSLYNSLQAVNIKSYLVLTSTRNKAVPTRLHPVIDDFNYLLVKAIINNKTYFLDATKKQLPFGLIQHIAINGDGRVMDFKKGSYWETIKLNRKTFRRINAQLSLDDNNNLNGNLTISSDGFFAVNARENLSINNIDNHLENFESKHPNIEVESFNHQNLDKKDNTLHQIYSITFDEIGSSNKLRINPFLIEKVTKNPFKLNKREYPVDYGYPRSNTYTLSLKLPEGYTIKSLPQNTALSLPNKGGRFILNFKNLNNTINIYSKITLNKRVYSSEEYHYLKEFYNQIIKSQDAFIEIEKASN